MYSKTLISKSTLAAVLAGTALTLGSTGVLAQAADDADRADTAGQMQESKDASSSASDAASNAGDASSDSAENAGSDVITEGGFITQQADSQTLAKSILGISLRDGPGDDAKEIGKITDLILDENLKLDGVVVGVGGFLGIGAKDVGIPWEKIDQIDPQNKTAVTNLTKEELNDAPAFVTTEQKQKEEQAQRQMEENRAAPAAGGMQPAAPAK